MKRILVIAAHPDDEMLGCGGTLRKFIKSGCEVVTAIVAKGRPSEQRRINKFSRLANAQLGIKKVIFLNYPNLKLETYPLHTITEKLCLLIDTHKPDVVLTHYQGDINRDHQITFQAVLTATRPLPGTKPMEILCFETVTSTEWGANKSDSFRPNFFVDITDTFDDKMKALRHYDVEMRPAPHPRSYEGLRHLAGVRGMTIGVPYGEAFEIVRRIWK
jgi:LmbE family N-acetylglucosaminyl deacetylase